MSSKSSSSDQVVKFRDLAQFIKTKSKVDEAHVRQLITNQQYKPLRFLGKGRFGKVYLCSKQNSAKLFAVKVLNVERDRREYNWTWLTVEERLQSKADADSLTKFIASLAPGLVKDHMLRAEELLQDTMTREENPQLRRIRRPVAEREILQRMGPHPNVCGLLTSFRDNRFMCLVFDYFPCSTLQALVDATNGKLEEDLARFFSAQLLLALQFLQEKNVCHRDVKPSNILLDSNGYVALADFGLATRLRGGLKNMCGTAEYIAPEVLSEPMWSASGLDLWAFGVTLYYLLTGKTPFEGPDATSVFLNTLTAPVRFPDYVSPQARDLLQLLLVKETAKRPSMVQVQQHEFFAQVNWTLLAGKSPELVPMALGPKLTKLVEAGNRKFLFPDSTGLRRFDSLLK
ncbi:hypothetical protein BASA81_015042 [Batrachochytrium salamandrivorans]|nr:hypothetical protein BASA81_015042 [Batrachochytrium salamandrivorans]